ncbi:MAG TPA: biotin/lipoyl-binding protein, partial [Luteimonas sp.]|nr:biotin/lipoyl-binding protein [Luteimonas sp.]
PEPSPHVRIDSGVVEGDTVTIFYDPMIAKLIVHDRDRATALARLREALAACAIEGPKSNIAFLEALARHPAIVGGTIDTGYLDRHLDEFTGRRDADLGLLLAAATAALLHEEAATRGAAAHSTDPTSPWAIADGWRLGHAGQRRLAFAHGDERIELVAQGDGGRYRIAHGSRLAEIDGARLSGPDLSLRIDGEGRRFRAAIRPDRIDVHDGDRRLSLQPRAVYRHEASAADAGDDRIRAPMPGRVVALRVAAGDRVEQGQDVLVIEAMKMELALKAPRAGTVAELRAQAGDFVEADSVLAVLED